MDRVEINRPYPNHQKPIYMRQIDVNFTIGSSIILEGENYTVSNIIYEFVKSDEYGRYWSNVKAVFLQPR